MEGDEAQDLAEGAKTTGEENLKGAKSKTTEEQADDSIIEARGVGKLKPSYECILAHRGMLKRGWSHWKRFVFALVNGVYLA